MSQIPTFIAPSTKTFLGIARELTTGTPVAPVITMPTEQNDYSPEDTPKFLPDEAIRGVMTPLFNEVRGVENATLSFGGPAFLDVEGYWLDNTFGDLSTTGTSPANGTTLTASTVVGATSAVLGSATGYTSGGTVQIDAGSVAEVVILSGAPAGGTISFTSYPLRFAHSTGGTVNTVTGPFTHTWAILNSGNGQPPTHTITDYTALTAGVGARSYPSVCLAQLDLTGNAEQLLMSKVSGNSWVSAPAGTTPVATTAFVVPVANWRSTVSIGGTAVYDVGEWTASFKRKLQTYWTAQNSQNPFIIARGGLTATYGVNFTVPANEDPLNLMLIQNPVQVVFTLDNGLAGTNHLKITITSTTAQFVKSKVGRTAVLVGYDNQAEAVANTTDAGGSGGQGPATVQLINNVATY